MTETGIVNIHGRDYKTVALRVTEFRKDYPISSGWAITTELLKDIDGTILMRATVSDPAHNVVGTGYAEEVRGASAINRTSAIEVAETSAIGRALSACGYGGAEYASANEVERAIERQEELPESQAGPSSRDTARKIIENPEHKAIVKEWGVNPPIKNKQQGIERVAGLIEIMLNNPDEPAPDSEDELIALVLGTMKLAIDARNANV